MQPNAPTPNLEANVAANLFNQNTRSTDILESLANLSSDEVFTPPKVVNAILDLLPSELWSNPNATFLDPATKSGVFLREIVKRLNIGLAAQIPDLQTRIDHIVSQQVFGISTSEITGHMARRSVYCSRLASGKKSVTAVFAQQAEPKKGQGYVRYTPTQHQFKQDHCIHCGANASQYNRPDSLYSYAYPFLHAANLFEYLGVSKDMKFDVIIGNPPYQLSDGGNGVSAKALYHLFVEQAKKLNPRYLSMIIPARWYAGGKGLDDFRETMLNDKHIAILVDYESSKSCFSDVNIAGGICYFLWDANHNDDCLVINQNSKFSLKRSLNEFKILIRQNEAIPIVRKILRQTNSFLNDYNYPRNPFGFSTKQRGKKQPFPNSIKLLSSEGFGYIDKKDVLKNTKLIDEWKIIIGRLVPSNGELDVNPKDGYKVITNTKILLPGEINTESYLVLASFPKEEQANNFNHFISLKFPRFLLRLSISSVNVSKDCFDKVPYEDFNEPWTDEKLYAKYNLTDDEIAYIESMIRPMNDGTVEDAANGDAEFDSETGEDEEGVSDDE